MNDLGYIIDKPGLHKDVTKIKAIKAGVYTLKYTPFYAHFVPIFQSQF